MTTDPLTIWQSDWVRVSQARSVPLPGYLFVESLSGCTEFDRLDPESGRELQEGIRIAERLVRRLIDPERVYVLKFGEADQHIHFHIVPRTREVLSGYLESTKDTAPYNGARITAWIWEHAGSLGYAPSDIAAFVRAAREAS